MTSPINRAALVLLASGLSRRYGRKDKLTANLGSMPLVEHAAGVLAGMPALTRVAVCPSDKPDLRDRLHDRFVIALNKKPKQGLGHSIALGVQVALQFKPDAIVICMGDMPFLEAWLLESLLDKLRHVDIVHAGPADRVHPPTAFGPACFEQLRHLDGDGGARGIIGQGGFRVVGLDAPTPLLLDVDTPDALELAKRQLAIRSRLQNPQPEPIPMPMALPLPTLAVDNRAVDSLSGPSVDNPGDNDEDPRSRKRRSRTITARIS